MTKHEKLIEMILGIIYSDIRTHKDLIISDFLFVIKKGGSNSDQKMFTF